MKRSIAASVYFLILCAIFVFISKNAEAGFSKRVATGRGELVIQTSDGGYLLIGRIISPNFDFTDGFAIKMDASGKQLWKKRFKAPPNGTGSTTVMLNRAIEIADGYVVAGPVVSQDGQMEVMKLDRSGNLKWVKLIKPLVFEFANFGGSLAPTADGGFVFSGVYISESFTKSLLALKFNASGEILWKKTYAFAANATSISQLADGGYTLAGGPDGTEATPTNFILLRLNPTGGIRWKKILSIPQFNTFGHCIPLKDGGYALSSSNSGKHALVIRLNPAGSILWSKFYGDSVGNSDRTSIAQTTDGGLIVGADGENGSLIFKLDLLGNVLWKREFGNSKSIFQTTSVIATSEGGWAVAGWLIATGGHDFAFMIRFDSTGRAGCGSYREPSLSMTAAKIQIKIQPVPQSIPNVVAAPATIAVSTTVPSLTNVCP